MSKDDVGLPALKKARARIGMSQSALARELGVAEIQVRRWEGCQVSPSVWVANAAADALGVTVKQLLGLEPLPDDEAKGA